MLIVPLMKQEVYKWSQLCQVLDCSAMLTHLCLGVIIFAVFTATVAQPEINVVCGKDSVTVTWRITEELVPYAGRLFLGNCMPSKLRVLDSREGEALFNYKFSECKFRRLIKGKRIVFQNEMTYRPHARPKPATFVHTFECAYKRPEVWVPPFLNPGAGASVGRGGLVFHMALLNEQLTSTAKTNVIPLGSFMPIWAAVEQKSHQPLLLLMEECVAASTPVLHPSSQVYPIISNKGCLVESKQGNALFLPRYHSSAVILYLQSFKFGLSEEVYIHCKLLAWDPQFLDESKKACQYVPEHGRWELLDNPAHSSLCSCCDSTCTSRSKRGVDWESHGFSHTSVLGPLIIVEPSHSKTNSTAGKTILS